MVPSRTHFSKDPNVAYAAKTPFTGFGFSDSTTTPSIPEQVLFTLASNAAAGVAYLQVLIDLLPEDDGSQGRFTGSVSQEILIVTTCS